MTVRRFSLLLTWVIAVVVAAHLVWSAAVAVALERFYPHRVVDLRRWIGREPGVSAQRELLARFIDVEVSRATRPTVAFFGSSFTFGYPWQERIILTRRFAELRPDRAVINASVTGGDLSLVNNWGLCAAKRQQIMLDAAIVEIPVINTVVSMSRQHAVLGSRGPAPLETCAEAPLPRRGYLPFVLGRPLGLGWVRFLWDVEAYEKPDRAIVIAKVPVGYFVSTSDFDHIKGPFREQIAETIRNATIVARRVYVFPSPVYLPGLRELDEDVEALRRQLDVSLEACRSVPNVTCLDPERFYVMREAFLNMTHLNQRGHQAMAEWLAEHVDPLSTPP